MNGHPGRAAAEKFGIRLHEHSQHHRNAQQKQLLFGICGDLAFQPASEDTKNRFRSRECRDNAPANGNASLYARLDACSCTLSKDNSLLPASLAVNAFAKRNTSPKTFDCGGIFLYAKLPDKKAAIASIISTAGTPKATG